MEKVALKAAEKEFERFVTSMDLAVDTEGMDAEDKKDFTDHRDIVVRGIREGSVVINDNGELVFTPQRSEGEDAITFHEATGATLMAMDKRKANEDMRKLFASMAETTHTHSSLFSKMKMSDLKVCMAAFTLLMA